MLELSTFFNSVLPELAPDAVRSFGAGGQIYSAEIFGGFNVSAETENALFTFRRNDSSVANAKALTNLHEAGKIGSTMEFLCTHVGFRLVKFDGSPLSSEEAAAEKALLQSALVEIGLGSDNTKVGEFSGLHLCAPVDSVATESTANANANIGGVDASNFIRLRIPVPMQKNVELRGNVNFAKAPATVLTSTPNTFGFVVILYGVKIVAQ